VARGRVPKLTPEAHRVIVEAVSAGVPQKYAAQRAGVTPQSIRNWLSRGKREPSGIYFDFLAAMKKAEADAIARNVAIVQKAAVTTWTAAAWWLERRYPDEFGTDRRLLNELRRELKLLADQLAAARGPGGEAGKTAPKDPPAEA
jgi:transposase